MPRFRFTLESVLRLRNQKRDACRRDLGAAVTQWQQLETQHQQVLGEQAELREYLKQLSKAGTVEVGMVSRCHMHLAQLEKLHWEALLACEEAQQVVDAKRQILVEADREVKSLEKLEQKQSAEFLREQDHRELLEQEEILAANQHGKPLS
jgi:flagellar export protein FliJ